MRVGDRDRAECAGVNGDLELMPQMEKREVGWAGTVQGSLSPPAGALEMDTPWSHPTRKSLAVTHREGGEAALCSCPQSACKAPTGATRLRLLCGEFPVKLG
jgi:hypothetical protein